MKKLLIIVSLPILSLSAMATNKEAFIQERFEALQAAHDLLRTVLLP